MKTLVATTDATWRKRFVGAILDAECDVHTTRNAPDCINLLRKHDYAVVLTDDSLTDLNPLEFSLTVREFCGEEPIIIVADPSVREKLERFRRLANVQFVGTREESVPQLQQAVHDCGPPAQGGR